MKDVRWQSEIKQAVEELVRERRQKLLSEASEIRKATQEYRHQCIRAHPSGSICKIDVLILGDLD